MKKSVKSQQTRTVTLRIKEQEGKTHDRQIAELVLNGVSTNMLLTWHFLGPCLGQELDSSDCLDILISKAKAVNDGDLKGVEAMLAAQAEALNSIFYATALRSKNNMGEYTDTADRYMRLALKAQGQCRATLETLAAIKNPPVVYAKQANITQGNQQVNNGILTHAHAGKAETVQNELLEDKRDEVERVDLRASSKTGRSDPAMETVGAINRCKNDRRQSAICTKLL